MIFAAANFAITEWLYKIWVNYAIDLITTARKNNFFRNFFSKCDFLYWRLLPQETVSLSTFTKKKLHGRLHFFAAYWNSWTLDVRVGRWTLETGLWTLDSGRWTLDSGRWTLDSERFSDNTNNHIRTPRSRIYIWTYLFPSHQFFKFKSS